MVLRKIRLGLRKPRFFLGILTSILIVSSFSILAPSVRADTSTTPIDVTAPTSCQSLLAGSYTNSQSGIGQVAADGRGAAVCSWSLSNLSGAKHIRVSFEMNSSVPTPGPSGPRVTAFLGLATSAPVRIDPDLSAIFPNSTKTTTTTVDCCFLPAFLAFESDLWTNPDAPLSGDRIQKICQQQYPGYADDNIFHSYSIDMDIASQTTTWTADGGTASASCSGFTLLPTQVVFYARSSDDGNSMVAQIRNINVSTGAQQPDFSVTVSPASQEIPLTGDGTYNIQIVPHNNFDTDVTLAVRFSQVGLGCSFEGLPQLSCNDATTTISPGHSATLFISPQSPLQSASTYSLTVYATPCASNPPCSPDSSSVSQGVSFTTTKLTGIRNVITMTDFLVKDSGGIGAIGQCEARMLFITTSCFTIQQNFFVSLPGFPSNTGPYWAQNVLAIGRPLIPYPNNVVVWSGWELWNSTTTPYTLIGPFKLFEISGHSAVSTPTTFTLTSYINGDKLYMYSDYHSFVITLKSPGGYISRLGLGVFQPQLDIVGAPGGAQVTFGPPTDGSVQSFVQLESGPWSPLVTQTLLNCLSPCNGGTATGETSLALGWTQGGSSTSFAYKEGVNVEGVGFTPATGVGSAFLEGGSASVGDLALGVAATISGSSASNNTLVTVTSSLFAEQPVGSGGILVPSVGYYDVRITGISTGISTICITNPHVNSQSQLEYFDSATSQWMLASNTLVSQLTVCGDISVAALQETLIAVGDPTVPVALPRTILTITSVAPGRDGWYVTPTVDATFTSTETTGVGIADITVSLDGLQTVFSGSHGSLIVSGEGTHTLVYNASDNAGNKEEPRTLVVKVDSVPPSVLGSLDRTSDHSEWYNHPVNVSWSGADTTSGVSFCDSPFLYAGPDTAGVGLAGSCIDNAGNAGTSSVTLRYDSTPPATSSPQDRQAFILRQMVLANAICSDSLSGIETCLVPMGFLDTSAVGPHSYIVTATDMAGNVATFTVHYDVNYAFTLISPKSPNTRFQHGATIPLRFQLKAALGDFVSTARAQIWVDSLANPGTPSGSANSGNYFRYDSTASQYIFNLSTKGMTIGEHNIHVTLDDGTTRTVVVALTS